MSIGAKKLGKQYGRVYRENRALIKNSDFKVKILIIYIFWMIIVNNLKIKRKMDSKFLNC